MLGVMRVLRRRRLWARTGNVTPPRAVVPRRVNLISAALLIGGVAIGVLLHAQGVVDDGFALRMLWAATGWSFGYTLNGVGREIGLSRYVWVGLTGGVASSLILILPVSFSQAVLALGLGWSALLATSGVVAFSQAWAHVNRSAND